MGSEVSRLQNKEDGLAVTSATFKINGKPYTINLSTLPPDITLNSFIRDHAQLTATKFMCLEGGCGACVVSIRGKHPVTGEFKTWAANSCLTLLNTCGDWEITTCEGLGNKRDGYHPIQKRMAHMNASQCGFCSPGFVMNMYSLMESKNNQVNMQEIENSFGGNICRCTGYRPILDAMKSFASDSTIQIPPECQDIEDLTEWTCLKSGSDSCPGLCHKPLQLLSYDNGSVWYWPKNLNDLYAILSHIDVNEEYMLVGGNTAHGVYRRSETMKHFIDINGISDLKQHNLSKDKLALGANLSLSETMDIFEKSTQHSGFEYCRQLWQHFDLIANVPVRNNGTLAGNISIKKKHREFTSDIFLLLETLNVKVVVYCVGSAKQSSKSISEFLEDKSPKTVILAFELPAYPKENIIFKSYKIMPRAQNAHGYINAGFLLELQPVTGKVRSSRLCFGGIRPDFVHAVAIEEILQGQCFYDSGVVAKIFAELPSMLEPNAALPDASPEYRRRLACGLMLKFFLDSAPLERVKVEYRSGGSILKRDLSSGLQTFDTEKNNYPVTQPVEKIEAMIQCSGEAKYMNDILTTSNSVYCAFVGATKVGSTIESIDPTQALQVPGVVAFYSAKDIPGVNSFVDPLNNYEIEELFTTGLVRYYDQPLGMIVALNSDIANRATSKVKIIYSNINSTALMPTIQDVLANRRLDRVFAIHKSVENGGILSEDIDISGKGIFELGLQFHFTLEPQTCVAIPFEQGLQVWPTTQWMDQTQAVICKMLLLQAAQVQLKIRRLGGGYGSRTSRGNAVTCAAALAAYKLNRPARFVQTLESMMIRNGKRWACRSDYEFQVRTNGQLVRLKNTFYEDAGCSLNENLVIHITLPTLRNNCYALTDANHTLEGNAVVTDATSNTFCRAPGYCEAIAMLENVMEHIAFECNIDAAEARMINLKEGHKLRELLPKFLTSREYKKRKEEIDIFNANNRWLKKGIGLAIMQYPFAYWPKFGLYPATISVYHIDGSVVISHGGIEMGQGMNTKIAQVAAFVLGIPLDFIKIEATDTINAANSLFTNSSMGSESLCYAVRSSCNILNDRLKPIRESLASNASWREVIQAAWQKSINLIVSDQYKAGDMQNYSIYGLALTEVEVDVLTGNHLIKRVDILEDAGESLSPFVDIGQIEGAFVMGLGYWLTEQMVYDRQTGELLTTRTWNYKPPGAKDIPIDFRIEMLQGSANTGGFMRSKTTGEPPTCLAVSVIFAIRQAILSARHDAGLKREWVRLGAPTTPETIVLNAGSDVSSFSLE